MPNHKAAEVIASSLHELVADDGTVLRDNMLMPAKSMPQEWHDGVNDVKRGRAQGIIKAIEDAGGHVVMPGDGPTPEPAPAQWVSILCTLCQNQLMRVNLVQPNVAGPNLIGAMHALDPQCPHHPDAERQ
jgi:hypothetical protein